MKNISLRVIFTILVATPLCYAADPITHPVIPPVQSYLEKAIQNSEDIRALDLEIKSLENEIEARELELSAILGVELNKYWDDRPSLSNNPANAGRSASLSLTKPFATGTRFAALSSLDVSEYRNDPSVEQNAVNWEIGLFQSLWQDSFGRQTRLRRRRDQNELRSRYLELVSQRQQTLITWEALYWDVAYAQQALKIRQENLDRSRQILSWMEDRFKRSAAERSDILQARSLASTRDLQLQVAQDDLKRLEADLHGRLNLPQLPIPEETELQLERRLGSFPAHAEFAPDQPVLIDDLQAQAEANYLGEQAKLDKDRLKPVLEAGYSYGQGGLDASRSQARREAGSQDNDVHTVGVVFAAPLAFSHLSQARRATELRAEAQRFRSARFQRQSQVGWVELERNIREQKVRVETAVKLAKLQVDKATEERARYLKGRSTTFQAITFEQEAAESQLLVLQLQAELRRTEAQGRAYIRNQDAPL